MAHIWMERPKDRMSADVEIVQLGGAILVWFRDPTSPLAYAAQAAVSVGLNEHASSISGALVALGFAAPVAADAESFVLDLVTHTNGLKLSPVAARATLRRVEFRQ